MEAIVGHWLLPLLGILSIMLRDGYSWRYVAEVESTLEKYMCQLDWIQWCAVVSLVMNNQFLYKLGESVLLTKYYLGDQIKNQMGGARSTY